MTLEEIYYIGQTIAVVAVIGSLIAIFFQMRLQSSIRQTEMARSMTDHFTEVWSKMYADPAFTRLIRVSATHWENLSDNQKFVVHAYWAHWALVTADQLYQSGDDPKPGTAGYKMVAWMVGLLRMPGPAAWWKMSKFFFDPAFQSLIDRLQAENAPGTESHMNFPLWQASEDDLRLVLAEAQPQTTQKVDVLQ